MELLWSNSEILLSSFVEQFTLPQIVQIGEGVYGDDEETSLSGGQELNLHLVNEKRYFIGLTESGEEIHIPLNSPHMVDVSYERSLTTEKCTGYQLEKGTVKDKSKEEAMFIADVSNHFKLPFRVKFIPSENGSDLPRGLIHLQEIVNKKIVVATSREMDCQSILTFADTLGVTVFPLKAEYRKLCENLNVNLDIEEIGNTIEKDDKVYYDVSTSITPYAQCLFAKRPPSAEKRNDSANTKEEGHGYIDMRGADRFFRPPPKLPHVTSKMRKSLSDTACGINVEKKTTGYSDDYVIPKISRCREAYTKTEDYTVHEVGLLLRELNLSQYRETFKQEQVDGQMLKDIIDKESLQSHFEMNEFHAHKLKKALKENWRPSVHH